MPRPHATRNLTLLMTSIVAFTGGFACKSDIWAHQPPQVIAQYRVPDSAKRVAAGTGVLEMTAPQQGIVYAIDDDDQRTIRGKDGGKGKRFSRVLDKTLLLDGQRYFFDTDTGTVGVRNNDRATVHVPVMPGHHYELRFDTKELQD